MRLRKADLQRRINGQLTLRYEAQGLTSFAGLDLVGRFIRRLDLWRVLKGVEKVLPRSDFGAARLSLLVLAMLMAGARRVRHVEYLQDDPLVERLCGLSRLLTWHTLGALAARFWHRSGSTGRPGRRRRPRTSKSGCTRVNGVGMNQAEYPLERVEPEISEEDRQGWQNGGPASGWEPVTRSTRSTTGEKIATNAADVRRRRKANGGGETTRGCDSFQIHEAAPTRNTRE